MRVKTSKWWVRDWYYHVPAWMGLLGAKWPTAESGDGITNEYVGLIFRVGAILPITVRVTVVRDVREVELGSACDRSLC